MRKNTFHHRLPGFAEIPIRGYAVRESKEFASGYELLILVTPRKLRLADHLTRTISPVAADTGGPRNTAQTSVTSGIAYA